MINRATRERVASIVLELTQCNFTDLIFTDLIFTYLGCT